MGDLIRIGQVEGFEVFRCDDGSKWIRDTDLAERAELAEPRSIRKNAIEKAIRDGAILEAIGGTISPANKSPLFRKVQEYVSSGKGRTQAVDVYYLNHAAALVVIQRMRTPRAVELQQAMAMVFVEVAEGRLANVDDRLERSIEATHTLIRQLADSVGIVNAGLAGVVDKADEALKASQEAREDVRSLRDEVRDGFDRITKRKDPSKATVDHHTDVCLEMYAGRCPICRRSVIVDEKGRTEAWTIEHFVRRDKNKPHETMPACKHCNQNALEADKPAHQSAFAEYQRVSEAFCGPLFRFQQKAV